MSQYSSLSRAQLSYDYLHTNSTTHEFLFGALAELIDNARDASATKINFYTVANKELRGGFMLCCVDDGHGMDSGESADIVTFGKSRKKSMDSQMIGMYGNGLKSGSMRISNDLVMFTKCGQEMTCVFLSRSFHEIENIDEIIVPMPVFDVLTKKPNCKNANDKKKHQLEMSIILKYSPFKTEADFMREFDRIEGNSGTLIIMYNMKLLDTGEPELDIKSVEHDILLSNPDGDDYDTDEGLMPERRSFRAYTSILYVDPRMRIYIQSKKVQTKRLASSLYKPRMYRYSSNRFKARSEQDSRRALEESKIADNRAREAESKARNLENKLGERGSKEKRAELRKMQTTAIDYRKDAQIKKQMADRKSRATRGPKTLTFTFGINLEHRGQDGMFVYNCSRLIKMYQKVGPQIEGGIYCSGVVGIVDVPYLVLEPTHNKQDFADAKEYRHLQKAMGEHMVQYWKDVGIGGQGVAKFWETYGYTTSAWTAKASTETKYIRKRAMQIQTTIQCNLCLKWRILPFSSSTVGKEYADDWTCSLNPDPTHNRCSSSEQKLNIPERVLRKEVKTAEQKKEDLELEIKKKKEALTKLQKNKPTPRRGRQASSSSSESSESESSSDEEPPPPKKNRPSLSSSKTQSTSSSKRSGSSTPAQNTSNNRRSLNNSTSKNTSSRTPVPIKSTPTPSSRSSSRTHTPASTTKPSTTPVSTPKQPIGPASSNRRRIAVASDSSDSDEEESSTVKEPPAKKKTLSPPTAKMTPRSQSESDTETTTSRSNNASNKTEFLASRTENDTETPKKPIHVTEGDIGREVECKIGAKWFKGTVIEVNPRLSKWKVKFDIYPTDKHDRWYAVDSSDIKHDKTALSEAELPDIGINDSLDELESVVPVVTEPSQPDTQSNDKSSPTSKNSLPTENLDKPEQPTEDAPQQDEPSSSTPAAVNNVATPNNGTANDVPVTSAAASSSSNPTANNQYNDEIANGYRTCLRYFLPPQWIMDKDSVSTLSLQELVAFPLDDFFDHYEKGLRKLVGSFQYEAQVKQQECDTTQKKLSDVRKLIAKLLKSINEEFDIDPEADTEQVDELLAACVKQATTQ